MDFCWPKNPDAARQSYHYACAGQDLFPSCAALQWLNKLAFNVCKGLNMCWSSQTDNQSDRQKIPALFSASTAELRGMQVTLCVQQVLNHVMVKPGTATNQQQKNRRNKPTDGTENLFSSGWPAPQDLSKINVDRTHVGAFSSHVGYNSEAHERLNPSVHRRLYLLLHSTDFPPDNIKCYLGIIFFCLEKGQQTETKDNKMVQRKSLSFTSSSRPLFSVCLWDISLGLYTRWCRVFAFNFICKCHLETKSGMSLWSIWNL